MTEPGQHLPPEDEADLAALADDSLRGHRRSELDLRLAADPRLAAALERQRDALSLLAGSSVQAPLGLRIRVEELKAERPGRRLLPAAVLALVATLAALVILLAARSPGVEDVLAVALRPATAPAAAGEAFEGVRFPHYERWQAAGARTDVVDGRRVRTVFYVRDGRRIAYSIVSGPALGGDELRRLDLPDGRAAVTWTRRGRTCVIAASGVDADVLAKLAVW